MLLSLQLTELVTSAGLYLSSPLRSTSSISLTVIITPGEM